jgi:hypothetical protein
MKTIVEIFREILRLATELPDPASAGGRIGPRLQQPTPPQPVLQNDHKMSSVDIILRN